MAKRRLEAMYSQQSKPVFSETATIPRMKKVLQRMPEFAEVDGLSQRDVDSSSHH